MNRLAHYVYFGANANRLFGAFLDADAAAAYAASRPNGTVVKLTGSEILRLGRKVRISVPR